MLANQGLKQLATLVLMLNNTHTTNGTILLGNSSVEPMPETSQSRHKWYQSEAKVQIVVCMAICGGSLAD
jgi:hypothetical protein